MVCPWGGVWGPFPRPEQEKGGCRLMSAGVRTGLLLRDKSGSPADLLGGFVKSSPSRRHQGRTRLGWGDGEGATADGPSFLVLPLPTWADESTVMVSGSHPALRLLGWAPSWAPKLSPSWWGSCRPSPPFSTWSEYGPGLPTLASDPPDPSHVLRSSLCSSLSLSPTVSPAWPG